MNTVRIHLPPLPVVYKIASPSLFFLRRFPNKFASICMYAYVDRMERRREMFSSEATLVWKVTGGRDKVADSTKGAADMYAHM